MINYTSSGNVDSLRDKINEIIDAVNALSDHSEQHRCACKATIKTISRGTPERAYSDPPEVEQSTAQTATDEELAAETSAEELAAIKEQRNEHRCSCHNAYGPVTPDNQGIPDLPDSVGPAVRAAVDAEPRPTDKEPLVSDLFAHSIAADNIFKILDKAAGRFRELSELRGWNDDLRKENGELRATLDDMKANMRRASGALAVGPKLLDKITVRMFLNRVARLLWGEDTASIKDAVVVTHDEFVASYFERHPLDLPEVAEKDWGHLVRRSKGKE